MTHLLESLEEQEAEFRAEFRPEFRPEVRAPIYQRGDGAGQGKAPGYIIGSIVHRMIAGWESLGLPEPERRSILVRLARRAGLNPRAAAHALQRAEMMIANLRSHPIYEQVCGARVRYFELPFDYDSPVGPLHGVIDVLYQGQDGGWQLIDWKTEWAPAETAEQVIDEAVPQMAVYCMAVKEAMAVEPEVTVCLLNPKCVARSIAAEDLAAAWEEIDKVRVG